MSKHNNGDGSEKGLTATHRASQGHSPPNYRFQALGLPADAPTVAGAPTGAVADAGFDAAVAFVAGVTTPPGTAGAADALPINANALTFFGTAATFG